MIIIRAVSLQGLLRLAKVEKCCARGPGTQGESEHTLLCRTERPMT